MFAQEFFSNLNVPVGNFVWIQFVRLLMPARLHQIRAVQRATYRNFALVAAADGADFAVDARAMAARFARVADLAFHGGKTRNSILTSANSIDTVSFIRIIETNV
jgi:hypothetical protein